MLLTIKNEKIHTKHFNSLFSIVNVNACLAVKLYTEKFILKYGEKNTLIISAEIENQINQLQDQMEKENYMKMIKRIYLKNIGMKCRMQ